MTRKLASIQKIVELNPIPDALSIDVATILGWKCVVKKSEFKVGDKIVYFECDSVLPERAEFEFLRDRKFRIKTIKLRGQVSQGLVMPLSILPTGKYKEGQDVSELLGVTKYNPEGEEEDKLSNGKKNMFVKFMMRYAWFRKLYRKPKGGWPDFISKTDETRLQAMPKILDEENHTEFSITEKLDGQSMTVFLKRNKTSIFNKYEFGVCSRNLRLKREDNSNYWQMARKYKIESVLKSLIGKSGWVAIQGEVVGDGIQGNKYGLKGKELFVFNLIYPGCNVSSVKAKNILEGYGIPFVPILSPSWILPNTIDEAVEEAKGNSVLSNTLREGIVLRNNKKGISFKIINPDFLLKWKV